MTLLIKIIKIIIMIIIIKIFITISIIIMKIFRWIDNTKKYSLMNNDYILYNNLLKKKCFAIKLK